MHMQFSESFSISPKTGNTGWIGGASALMLGTGSTGITAGVRLWRDQGLTGTATNPLTQITLAPGQILPLKVKYVEHNSTVVGFN